MKKSEFNKAKTILDNIENIEKCLNCNHTDLAWYSSRFDLEFLIQLVKPEFTKLILKKYKELKKEFEEL